MASLFYSNDLCVYPFAKTTWPDCFMVGLEISRMNSLIIFFFFKFVLVIIIPLPFHIKFIITFIVSTKNNLLGF